MNAFTNIRTTKIASCSCVGNSTKRVSPDAGKSQKNFCLFSNTLFSNLKLLALLIMGFLITPGFLLGQSANLDQTRNGTAASPISPVNWVNGNAGEQNAHYLEGYSIPYRMHMTGLSIGSHELVIEWDTKDQNAHAIDYITYYDNLDYPAGSHVAIFGHAPEVVDPTDGITGLGAPSYFTIPAPAAPANAEVPGLPAASFNSLPANLKRFTIWNGTITDLIYVNQDVPDATTGSTKTSLLIKFNAASSNVLVAWAGHIAAEYDWGDGRGAGGVSGSPYHSRLISLDGKGGNQDRSLKSPAIVVADPICSISNAKFACPETPFFEFTSAGSSSGPYITYTWTLTNGTPSAGAKIDPATVNSPVVKVIPIGSAFLAGGTFSLSLKVSFNIGSIGKSTTCSLSPAGTISNVVVAATANPTQIDLAFSTTSQLNAVLTGSTDTDPSHYNFTWTQSPAAGGSLSANNIQNPVFTATAPGTYTFEVTATQKAEPNCSNKAQVTVNVGVSAPPCAVSGPTPVCPGSTNSYFYDPNEDNDPNVIPPPYTALWTLVNNTAGATFTTATNTNIVGVKAGTICNSSFTVRLTLTSPTGIQTSCEKTVIVNDVEPPVFTFCPPGGDLGCNPTGLPAPGAATATDNCGTPTITITLGPIIEDGCKRTQVRTYTASDLCENTATCTQTFTWTEDKVAPVFTTCPANQNLGCNPTSFPSATPVATDNCGNPEISGGVLGDPVNTSGCTWTRSRTWTATDACGNSATCTQVFTYTLDTEKPTFTTCPPNMNLGCNPATFPSATPVATDNCGNPEISGGVLGDPVNTQGCTWTRTRTWTATDACGNSATCTQVLTYTLDNVKPVFTTCPPNMNLGCNPESFPSATPVATDNCGTPEITGGELGNPVNTEGCIWTRTRTWTATDACGNTATCTQVLSYTVDITPWVFNLIPKDIDLECGAEIPAAEVLTATNSCVTAIPITANVNDVPADCSTGFSRIITRKWIATDACNNTATLTQVIRVKCCPDIICTYTQGYFGNDGGMACNGDDELPNKFSTFQTIKNSINAQGGTITIGNMAGKNVKITNSDMDINKVIEVLPGGGGSSAFTHVGSISIKNLPADYLKKGRINNTLFAQTLTLAINMGITDKLGNVPLEAGKYLVIAETEGCGSKNIKPCKYEWNGVSWVLTYSPYHSSGTISTELYNALGTKDVKGLLALANAALGGAALPAGVSLGAIASAVDMINNVFDECKLFVGLSESSDVSGWCTPPAEPPVSMKSKETIDNSSSSGDVKLQVAAFPNPAHSDGTFYLTIRSMESGNATIEYFNMNGSKLSQSNRLLQANVSETVKFSGGAHTSGAIVYKVSINGKFARGIVIRAN